MENRTKHTKTYKGLSVFLTILLVISFVIIVLFVAERRNEGNSPRTEQDNIPLSLVGTYETQDKLYMQSSSKKTMLIMGVNEKDVQYLLLLAIDENEQTLQPIHINRNTLCTYNELDDFGKITGSKKGLIRDSFKGPTDKLLGLLNVKDATNQLLCNIRIDYYMAVDLASIDKITDIFGGIEVDIDEDFTDINPKYSKGSSVMLSGKDSKEFVIGDETQEDVSRIERRMDLFIEGLYDTGKTGHGEEEDYFENRFTESTKYFVFNSNDIVTYINQIVDYDRKQLITLKGSETENGLVLDHNMIEEVCLDNIYN